MGWIVVDQRQPGEDHGPAWLPLAAGNLGIWESGSWANGNPGPPDGTATQTCQTGPMPRLACEHVPASVPDITTAVLPSRAQSTVGCPLAATEPSRSPPPTACGDQQPSLVCAVGWFPCTEYRLRLHIQTAATAINPRCPQPDGI
ncbi:hypothetical protein DHEL01_v204948 [Diaporthe helianthi]|uniref:Uncharacterized protein n=1 Tax=Diaporthe helianthi TaxID=158607 RepID=A0A2P5I2E0_DIAHE|nr:hypothetical protein DHEL01_v204948 [Diaporthe helianthi]